MLQPSNLFIVVVSNEGHLCSFDWDFFSTYDGGQVSVKFVEPTVDVRHTDALVFKAWGRAS